MASSFIAGRNDLVYFWVYSSSDDLPAQVLATILGSIGLLICLFGHRLFKTCEL